MAFSFLVGRVDAFDGTSGNSSSYTSPAILAADYDNIAVSWVTITTAASLLTIQGSNEDGFQSSLATWSTLTSITGAGAYVIDPGMRWLRALRSSSESLSFVRLGLRA